jgi:phosphoglycolate phosphatase
MKSINLLIFDLDGTLVDTLEDIAASVNHTLARLGRNPIGRDEVRQYVGDGIEALMARSLGGMTDCLPEAVTLYKEHQRNNLVVRSALYPAVRETLEHFRTLPLAVISNKATEFVTPLIERLGVARYFKMVVGADCGLPLKPAPDAVRHIMAEFKATQEGTAIVGDGTTDVRAGKAAGITTCAVTYGYRSEEELKKAKPDYLIHSLAELKGLFAPKQH